MRHYPALLLFGLASGLLCLLAFPGALTGKSIMAPVDIFPNLFEHFHFMDPHASGIPANHHTIDQATYDLPLQYRIYQSLRQGIFPWWDPYTFGGRPLLADAHINGTDPIRLLSFLLLPFPLAYNLNLILKSILTGVGMFLLLRHLGHPWLICGLLALSFQFAGCFAIFFGHPWIQASFLFYPFLWISWDRIAVLSTWSRNLAASLLCTLIFYCGNLQSHAYLFFFALAYSASFFCISHGKVRTALGYTFLTIGVGALLAAPVLLNQIEFFLLSTRGVISKAWSFSEVLRGPFSLTGAFPWLLGTFRTLDLSKAVESSSLGFVLFIGTSSFLLALFASTRLFSRERFPKQEEWLSGFLLWGYLLILASPLSNIFYTRLSPLACLGAVILTASAISAMPSWRLQIKGSSTIFFLSACLLLAVIWIGELWAFHHFRDSIRTYFLERVAAHASSVTSPALRSFQIGAFHREVGLTNPEVFLSWLSLFFLLVALPKKIGPGLSLACTRLSLCFSLAAVVVFYVRFTPCQPMELWERLREGGPAQQRAVQTSAGNFGRFYEDSARIQNQVFPNAVACLYGINVVHGYSALQPASFYNSFKTPLAFPDFWRADWRILSNGSIQPYSLPRKTVGSCRIIWDGPEKRSAKIVAEAPGHLRIEIMPGPAGPFVWTDTFFPGWRASIDGSNVQTLPFPPFFSTFCLPGSPKLLELHLHYSPRFFSLGIWLFLFGFLALFLFSSKKMS